MSSTQSLPTRSPVSTYRVQLNQHFTFADAIEVVSYLHDLGITDLYASPYLQARPGSLHGYDISNHNRLNPEIGTRAEHAALSRRLAEHGMGQLLDIVPNHMGIGQTDNEWWMDVLENGPSSMYAPYFDIDWRPIKPELAGKVLLPVLGDQFGQVLEKGELRLLFDQGRFRIDYRGNVFPVSPKSSSLVLRAALNRMNRRVAEDHPDRIELESIVTALEHLPERSRTDAGSVAERRRESTVTRRRVSALFAASQEFGRALEETVEEFNGAEGDPHSFDRLERLLGDQAYRLAYWRVAAEEINYRRFFDVNDLAGVRVERGEVFQATHHLVLQLVQEGKITGLRIDHPDGLYNPRDYLRALQAEASRRADGGPFYVLVEKILTGEEPLPDDWPVAGTIGYDFMNRLNGLFVATRNAAAMDAVYTAFIGRRWDVREMEYEKKKLILRVALASELNVLAFLLDRLSEQNRRFRDFTLGSLTDALREVIACFPVYRTYIDAHAGKVSQGDREHVERAIRVAVRRNRSTSSTIFEFIRGILLLRWPEDLDEEARREHARFVMKFQQLTGPVMAKGVEDTTFYVYNRLISLNEVGGEPERFGLSPHQFDAWLHRRQAEWPLAMNSTSTHDTKRSEDVRARIDVLSEMPERWGAHVRTWAQLNADRRREENGELYPDLNDEYLLYQTLVGAWPLERLDAAGHRNFVQRIQAYMEKATREAKVHTSWINPNEEYDSALREFIAAILDHDPDADDPGAQNPFFADLLPFQAEVACLGMLNSLSQTAIKLTCPGVPDVYQGQEMWDLSLVDPDNRRPVDYELRRTLAREMEERAEGSSRRELARELVENWRDGRAKLYLTRVALHLRRRDPELFLRGDYVPLSADGRRAEHVVAFARRHAARTAIVVAPRLWATLLEAEGGPLPRPQVWDDTHLQLPGELLSGPLRNLLDGEEIRAAPASDGARLPIADLLRNFPVAILEGN